jgi:septum formation protein
MIYLASKSPRRQELLKLIRVPFTVLTPHSHEVEVDETPHPGEDPAAYALRVTLEKNREGRRWMEQRQLEPHPVLSADTTVSVAGRILGKPESPKEAADFLNQLSGRAHQVITAVAVSDAKKLHHRVVVSEVHFRPLGQADINRYLATGEYQDKAGGYAIQGYASRFIARLEGSYSGVVGLPLYETDQLLALFLEDQPAL